jgi:hypothetical protein
MRKDFRRSTIIHLYGLLLLVTVLSACGTTEASSNTNTSVTSSTASAKAGEQPCPAVASSPAYWDPIVPTQAAINKVEKVVCANLTGSDTLQALVTVRTVDGHTLDVYVYDGLTKPNPNQLFELRNLYNGDVQISGYNSLLTAEVNTSLEKPTTDSQPDVYREFAWSSQVGTFVPVAFPGLYPLTRYEAKKIQKESSGDYQDAKAVVQKFLTKLPYQFPTDITPTIGSGGGANDAQAVVNIALGTGTLKITLQRFEGNTSGGIWVVSAAETAGLSITAPQSQDHLVSPVTVTGKGDNSAVAVLDRTYKSLKEGTLSTALTYTSDFKTGKQEGLVVLYNSSSVDGTVSGMTVVNVLLG